jgi:hypothetical protein
MIRVGGRFRRVEPRCRARAFVLGLLSELPRKNCWTIAEYAGDPSPDGMQHLLARARWDAGGVRDDVRGYVIEHLGDPGAVLVERWLAVKVKLGIGDVVNPRVSRRKENLGEVVYPDPLPFVFTTLSTGRTVAARDMREMLKRRAGKAGLGRRAHLHGLRHSHAVALDRAGNGVPVISSQLGHGSLAITTSYLAHISADQKVAAVSGVFG